MKAICAMIPLSHSHDGKPSHAQMKVDDPRLAFLLAHLDLLLNLGEVCATCVVATLVDGMQGHANHEGTINHVYLPILIGYRTCYKRYMLCLGLHTQCTPDGAIIVVGLTAVNPVIAAMFLFPLTTVSGGRLTLN